MVRRLALWAFVAVGIAVVAWGAVGVIWPSTSCRGVAMGPGDVCHTSNLAMEDTGKVQRYEDRIAVARQQAPFAIAAGAAMAGFGVVLMRRPTLTDEAASARTRADLPRTG